MLRLPKRLDCRRWIPFGRLLQTLRRFRPRFSTMTDLEPSLLHVEIGMARERGEYIPICANHTSGKVTPTFLAVHSSLVLLSPARCGV